MKFNIGDRIVKIKGSNIGQFATVISYTEYCEGIIIIKYDFGRTDATFESLCELVDKQDCFNID
jgi:hypothetical protein